MSHKTYSEIKKGGPGGHLVAPLALRRPVRPSVGISLRPGTKTLMDTESPSEALTERMKEFQTDEGNWEFPEDLQGRLEAFKDFRTFLFAVWAYLGKTPSRLQYDIARFLQYGGPRLCVFAYRAAGKSWVCSAYVLWILYWWPDKKVLVVSASSSRANEFTKFTLQLIRGMKELQHMAPDPDQRCSGLAFDVRGVKPDHNPSIKSVGILGQMAGSHADVIVGDDIEVPKNSDTPMAREKLKERSKEFEAIVNIGGKQVILGTPQNEQTVYSDFIHNRGFRGWVWPVRYPDGSAHPLGELAPILAEDMEKAPTRGGDSQHFPGKQTDPQRGLSESELLQYERTYGRSGFALQFMLDTRLSDDLKQPLLLTDLIVADLARDAANPTLRWTSDAAYRLPIPHLAREGQYPLGPIAEPKEYQKYTAIGLFVDPSGKGKDETAWSVVACLNGMFYVLDFGGYQGGGYDDRVLEGLAETARAYKVNVVVAEDNFGNGMFTKLLTPILLKKHQCGIEEVRVNTRKELRIIQTLEPVMNQHRLVVDKGALERDYRKLRDAQGSIGDSWTSYAFTYQLSRISLEKNCIPHDDRLEAVSMGVSWWADQAALDVSGETARRESRNRELFLQNCVDGIIEKKPRKTYSSNRGLGLRGR